MSRVLITGAAGAIGYHLSKYLKDRGDSIVMVDNFIRSKVDDEYLDLQKSENVTHIEADLSDPLLVEELPLDVDYVYHLAAMNGTQNFYTSPFEVVCNSTLPTLHLLRHYSQSGRLRRFIYAGSSESYASTVSEFDWPVPTAENVPLCIADPRNVRWSYGASKLHGEVACFAAEAEFGIPSSIIRFHNVYGPRMGDKHVIPDFLLRAFDGVYELYGFSDTRSFIYVDDAVRATVCVGESDRCKNEIINVGGDYELSMITLGEIIMRHLGIDQEIRCFPSPQGSVRRRAPDLSKLFELTDYRPRVALEQGLRQTIDYYKGCLA